MIDQGAYNKLLFIQREMEAEAQSFRMQAAELTARSVELSAAAKKIKEFLATQGILPENYRGGLG